MLQLYISTKSKLSFTSLQTGFQQREYIFMKENAQTLLWRYTLTVQN